MLTSPKSTPLFNDDSMESYFPTENNFRRSIYIGQKSFKYQYKKVHVIILTLNASLASFVLGWSFGVFDTIQLDIAKIFGWNDDERRLYSSLISSAVPIGAVFGSFISGQFMSKYGRRFTFIIFDIIAIIGIGITLILNEYCMIFGRFINGIAVGAFAPLVSVYVNEFAPYEITGLCGAIYEFFYCFGVFCSFLFGLNLPSAEQTDNQWWRFMIAFPGITTFINLILLLTIFKHETPKFLYITKNDRVQCNESISSIYLREADNEKFLSDLHELSLNIRPEISYSELFSKYKFRLFLATIILVAQQACGIDALLMYSNNIFIEILEDKRLSTIYTNLIGFIQVLSALGVIFIIEKLGRRTLLLIGLSLISISLYSISVFYSFGYFHLAIYTMMIFTLINGMSLSPLSYVYAADILPDNGISIGMACNFMTSFLVSQTFLYLKDTIFGIGGTFCIYATWTSLTCIISFFLLKETRGLSATKIDDLFS